jgi:hypothetical protein
MGYIYKSIIIFKKSSNNPKNKNLQTFQINLQNHSTQKNPIQAPTVLKLHAPKIPKNLQT